MLESKDEHPRPRLYHVLPLWGTTQYLSRKAPSRKAAFELLFHLEAFLQEHPEKFPKISWIQQLYDDTMYTVYYNYNIIYLPFSHKSSRTISYYFQTTECLLYNYVCHLHMQHLLLSCFSWTDRAIRSARCAPTANFLCACSREESLSFSNSAR